MPAPVSELEVALLEAEVEQLERELALGYAMPGKRRPFAHELRAGVRFAELDRQAEELAVRLTRAAHATRATVAAQLEALDLPDDPSRALAAIRELVDPQSGRHLPIVTDVVDRLAERIAVHLRTLTAEAAAEVLAEARRQGLEVLPDLLELDEQQARQLADQARRAAAQPVARSLAVALETAERLAAAGASARLIREGMARAVRQASPKSTEDVARQAASAAQGIGRNVAARAAPRPRRVYASELLDSNTCAPCSRVDGREYASLEEALLDYPGAGGHVFCDGGQRCRGTLVYVWDESPPTTDRPPPPGPAIDPPPERPGPIPPDDRVVLPARTPAPEVPRPSVADRPPGHPDTPGVDALPRKPATPFEPSAVDVDLDSAATNPGYGSDSNYGVNCVHVANTYELRRRGLEVTASPLPPSFRGRGRSSQDALNRWRTPTGGKRQLEPTTPKRLEAEVMSWPVGARGWVVIRWGRNAGGGGHIYNVERTEAGPRWVEAQLGTVLDATEHARRLARRKTGSGALYVARVDDLTPTDDVLEYVRER